MSALIYITTEYILIEPAHIYMVSQNLHPSIFVPLLIMDINMCQGRETFQSPPSIQICFYYLL